MSDLKDTLSTILAIVLVIAGAVNTYLQSLTGNIQWIELIMIIVGAVVAYLTGKTASGKKKSVALVQEQEKLQEEKL